MKKKLMVVGVIWVSLVLLTGCTSGDWSSLDTEIVEHEKRCLALEKESIVAIWEGEDIVVTAIFSTPVPCYLIKSVSARQRENKIEVDIKVEREEGVCIECIGCQKITCRVKAPLFYPDINLELQLEIDDQKVVVQSPPI